MNLKKYKPIRIHSIRYGYGWWFGKYTFYFGKKSTTFGILPIYFQIGQCSYKNGTAIEHGMSRSWSDERQREYQKDREKK